MMNEERTMMENRVKSYQYKVVKMPGGSFEAHQVEVLLNELGAKGWKLVGVSNNFIFFRRKYEEGEEKS